MLAKKTVKNQITLPKAIVDKIPDTDYFEVSLQKGEIILKPVHIEGSTARLRRIRRKIRALGLTETDIEEAIHWARSR
ncbi:MAG: AbrB family transcriptional regulator [Acidobacteria bacterium]|nr:MAG: AbrB family transcriptional regulator [Acidobacteriota bacterium]